VVELADDADPIAEGIAVHNQRHDSPAYAFALASLQRPDFPLPIGVFRAVERPTYDSMLEDQVTQAVERRGDGDLRALLHSGDTWTVEA
jgi:2-oxoglutarate ferredoxin oxidoreductase subunit beta